ncbi:histidine phosphotransferase family protein [Pikeienuella sp. HZG-20]|uniref:histidine phosphotransferase family protein n=1 Tax=Paludibacillus litoralis TaxID=3133267 RepID=UPI0030EF8596
MDDLMLSGLVSSRICHDLINPVGAIGNGMELLRGPGGGEEEMRLIADCADAASNSLQFLRIAFGSRAPDEAIETRTLAGAADAYFARRRVRLDWGDIGDAVPFRAAQPILLLALAGAGALPRGGQLTLSAVETAPLRLEWALEAGAAKIQDRARALLAARPALADIAPGEVHFVLLWLAAKAAGARPYWSEADGAAAVGLS